MIRIETEINGRSFVIEGPDGHSLEVENGKIIIRPPYWSHWNQWNPWWNNETYSYRFPGSNPFFGGVNNGIGVATNPPFGTPQAWNGEISTNVAVADISADQVGGRVRQWLNSNLTELPVC